MSITSANPDDLGQFVTSASRDRKVLQDRLADLKSLQMAVVAGSPDYNVASGALTGAAQMLDGFEQNERFVDTVRDELLKADRDPETGIASVANAAVATALKAAGVAQKPPPVRVEPGVLLGIPPTSGFVDDPICAANGNFLQVDEDLSFPGWAAVLNLVRVYNSLGASEVGAFGPGWSSPLDLRLDHVEGGVLRAHLADGAVVPFAGEGGDQRAVGNRPLRITVAEQGWVLHEGHTKSWRFDGRGRFLGGTAGPATLVVERDEQDRIVGLSETRSGRSLRFEWSGGRVVAAASNDGRIATYRYDGAGVLIAVERPKGGISFGVDGPLITSVTDADGVVQARNAYDESRRVVEQTNELDRTTRYGYSELGTTLVSDTVGGPRNAFTHDTSGNLTAMVDGTGRALRLTYDGVGRIISMRDRTGALTEFTYDRDGNLAGRTDPDGLVTRWEWDALGRLVAETHRNGATTTYAYTRASRHPTTIVGPDAAKTSVTVNDADVPVEVVDPDGIRTRFEWDDDGQLVAVIDGLGNRTTFGFDDAGELVDVVDASGMATTFRNDGAGRVVEAIVSDGISRSTYTAAGRRLSGADGEGVSWTATYGDHGRLATFRDGEGATLGFEWDPFGNLAAVVAPDGGRYLHHYDNAGHLIAATDAAGNTATREVDAEGRVVRVTDAAGRAWRRELDVLGRTTVSVAPDGGRTTYEYHPTGAVKAVVQPDGARVETELDAAGRVGAIIDAFGGRFELRYSPGGRLQERRSPGGRVQHYDYDAAGRAVSVPGTGGEQVALELDPRGRVLSRDSARGRVTFDYSVAGELIGVTSPVGTSRVERDRSGRVTAVIDGEGVRSMFHWDDRGLLGTATDPAGLTASFDRDVRGRLSSITSARGEVTRFGYDEAGFLSSLGEPHGTLRRLLDATGVVTGVRRGDGSGFDRTLDGSGRTRSITSSAGELLAEFTYDPAGRLLSSSRNDSSSTYRWDATGRLRGIDGPSGSLEVDRDADGLVAAWTHNGNAVRVERDQAGDILALIDPAAGRVERPPRPELRRDRAGRMTGSETGAVHRYDDAGRLVETLDRQGRRWSFAYGEDGLLAGEESPLGSRVYHRGFQGRLERVEEGDGSVTTYGYDGAGRRTSAVRSDGSETRWWWDALGLLVRVEHRAADGAVRSVEIALDAHGRPYRIGDAGVVWDDVRSGKPLAIGRERFLHLAGRVRSAGTQPNWLEEPDDPWGSDGSAAAHVGFRGELAADDLIWMGERVYDARTREFLSPDPLLPVPGRPGFQGVYAYGFLDPVNFVDPSGRRPVSQQEFDDIREREERGRLGQAWEAMADDPWGTLAMIGVVAVGVGLMFVPGGQAFGIGILAGVAMDAVPGLLTGNFSPTSVAVGGAFGAIPGGNSYRTAIAVGLGTGAVQEVGAQALSDRPMDWGNVVEKSGLNAIGGAGARGLELRLAGARPSGDLPAPPTLPAPAPPAAPRPAFAVDASGTAHVMPPPGGVIEIERIAPRPVKAENAVDAWDDFLGPGPHSNVHPRTGELDPDRIVAADGTRSIRYGPHEMGSRPTKHHYHEETWQFDSNHDIWWVDNDVVRVPLR